MIARASGNGGRLGVIKSYRGQVAPRDVRALLHGLVLYPLSYRRKDGPESNRRQPSLIAITREHSAHDMIHLKRCGQGEPGICRHAQPKLRIVDSNHLSDDPVNPNIRPAPKQKRDQPSADPSKTNLRKSMPSMNAPRHSMYRPSTAVRR